MAYIGNGRTLLIFGPNVQDDIIPDGVSSTFTLSQEVPGGYEGNVVVVRKRYVLDQLVAASTAVSFVAPDKIEVLADQDLAAALSIVQPPQTDNDASNIIVAGASNAINNGVFRVVSVAYNGSTVVLTLNTSTFVNESGSTITLTWGKTTDWEILEPEIDYVIGGSGIDLNKLITFGGGYIPAIDDQLYVIHKGDATYNFVPSQASVGPDQLQTNLRNFVCNRFTGDNTTTTFALTQEAVNSKTLLVTVNGVEKDGDDPDQAFVGDWQLDVGGLSITFHTAPATGVKIKILHLGFSTVARRASLSPGQAGLLAPGTVNNAALGPNSVTTDKIAPGGVTHTDVGLDAIDGTQILLNNEEYLRGKDFGGTARGLLKINSANATVLNSVNDFILSVADVAKIKYEQAALALCPVTTNEIKLGKPTNKWKELYVEGVADLGSTTVDDLTTNGNATINGDITITGTVDNIDISDLQTAVSNLQSQVDALLIPGTMVMWMKDVAAPTGWLTCNGQAVSRTTYASLFTAIGTTFGVGDGSSTFNVPDLRQRHPIGKAAAGTGSGWGNFAGVGGAIDHTHIGGAHTHDMSAHTHQVPGHYHGMGSGADLNISISGSHTTTIDISHGHTASSVASATSISIVANSTGVSSSGTGSSNANVSISDPGHSHGGNTGGNTSFSTSTDGTHHHGVTCRSGPPAGSSYKPDSNRGPLSGNDFNTDTDGAHSHSIPAGNHTHTIAPGATGVSISQSGHTHTVSISDPTHSHSISDPGHSHTINVNALGVTNKLDTNGQHSHASGSFAGRIGNVTSANDGNGNFNTGAPSSVNTGSAGAVATTSNNAPFHTVHFIIKT